MFSGYGVIFVKTCFIAIIVFKDGAATKDEVNSSRPYNAAWKSSRESRYRRKHDITTQIIVRLKKTYLFLPLVGRRGESSDVNWVVES